MFCCQSEFFRSIHSLCGHIHPQYVSHWVGQRLADQSINPTYLGNSALGKFFLTLVLRHLQGQDSSSIYQILTQDFACGRLSRSIGQSGHSVARRSACALRWADDLCQDALTFRVSGQGDRLRNLNYLLQSKKQVGCPRWEYTTNTGATSAPLLGG